MYDISSGSPTRLTAAFSTATYWAKEPQWVKPGWVWASQTCWSPAAHAAQRPQAHTNGTVTRSPGRAPATPAPTSSTVPASSWPGTCGKTRMSGSLPCQPCQSLRHTPVASTRITAPPADGRGSGTSRTSGGAPNAS